MSKANPKYKESGKRVQRVRKETDGRKIFRPSGGTYPAKLNQSAFAEIVDIKENLLNSIESGRRRLTEENAEKISAMAQIPASIEWLMGEDVPRNAIESYITRMNEADQLTLSFNSSVMILMDAANDMGLNISAIQPETLKAVIPAEKWDGIKPFTSLSLSDFEINDGGKLLVVSNERVKKLQRFLVREAKVWIEGILEEGDTEDGEQ